jgi:hypothetical protein
MKWKRKKEKEKKHIFFSIVGYEIPTKIQSIKTMPSIRLDILVSSSYTLVGRMHNIHL